MSIFDDLLGLLAPFECIMCGAEGQLLCSNCLCLMPAVEPRCYRCRRLSDNFRTCKHCRSSSNLRSVYVATDYDGPAKELIWRLKFKSATSGAAIAARCMSGVHISDATLIVPVPTATRRIRQRGYDQTVLITKAYAKLTNCTMTRCLARTGSAKQIGSTKNLRSHQLKDAFRVLKPERVAGKSVLLVDDVVTTGSTLEAAAQVLRAAGAHHVDGLVFAQP